MQFESTFDYIDYMNPFNPKLNPQEYKKYSFQSLDEQDKTAYPQAQEQEQAQEPENLFDSLNYSTCLGNNNNNNFDQNSKSQINFQPPNKSFAENLPPHFQGSKSLKSLKNSFNQIPHKGLNEYEEFIPLNRTSTHDPYHEFSLCETPQFLPPEQNSDSVYLQSTFSEIHTSEDDFEESPFDPTIKKEKSASDKSRSRKNSNLLRNAPGLIFGRVKKGCKEYIGGNEEERDHEDADRLEYIKRVIENGKLIHLNFNEEKFVKFLEKFNGSTKTWKSLKDACMEDKLNARIFLQCVDSFLSQDGEKDFENWVSEDRGSDVKSEIKRKKFTLLKKLHSTVGFLYRKQI